MTRSCFDRKARHEPFFSILLEDQIGKFQSATSAPVFPLIDQTLQRLELFEHFYLASSAANKPK